MPVTPPGPMPPWWYKSEVARTLPIVIPYRVYSTSKKLNTRPPNSPGTRATGRELPAMYVTEFLSGKLTDLPLPGHSCPSGLFKQDLHHIFSTTITEHLRKALQKFNGKIPGFASYSKAILIAPETRTSAPVAIERDVKTLMSLSHSGLYPCGEGAGYAGGITSAAADGIRVCEAILHS